MLVPFFIILHLIILKNHEYSMTFSYLMAFATVSIITYTYFYNYKINIYNIIFNAIICSISLLIVTTNGSRGALIGMLVAIIIVLIQHYKFKFKTIFIALIITIPLFIILLNVVLPAVYDLLLSQGLESRNLRLLLKSDTFFYLANREFFYTKSYEAISTHPFLGVGMFGDRVIEGSYTHNIYLELLLNYGVFFGSIICIVFTMLLIRSISSSHIESDWKLLSTIFFSCEYIKLLISGSYLEDIMFWIMLGVIINANLYKSKLVFI